MSQAKCFKIDDVVQIREKIAFSTVEVHKPEVQNLESEITNDGSILPFQMVSGFSHDAFMIFSIIYWFNLRSSEQLV